MVGLSHILKPYLAFRKTNVSSFDHCHISRLSVDENKFFPALLILCYFQNMSIQLVYIKYLIYKYLYK
jgi:hypothetical protein